MKTQKTWFITGASRGLGLIITKAVLASGDNVVATVRSKPEALAAELASDNLRVFAMDVTDEAQVQNTIDIAVEQFGGIDVLLNNAGYGLLGAVEEASDHEIRNMFNTNVFGTLNVIRHILPYLRKQGSGHIINISSVGGLAGSAGWGLYNSTKFAVEGFSEALSKELSPLGIYVTAVAPGYFRTDFLDSSSLNIIDHVIVDYAATVGKMRAMAAEVNKKQPGDPQKLADALLQIAKSEHPPLHLLLGKDSLNAYQTKTANLAKDIDIWYDLITGTDHDDIA